MPVDTVADLVSLLQEHTLLESPQLDEARSVLCTRCPDPRSLAKELIQRNWLTPYQINQLFQGRGGDLVLGKYLLLERLGEGGMGQVFKARDRRLGRLVALKLIRKDRLAGPDAIRRFQREVQSAAQLQHPNIVHAIDTDEIDGAQFLVMEFVEGIDLAKLVKHNGPLPVHKACDYVRQASHGLQHAYDRGLVHRDIKPANLLLAKNGVVKLLDLGLARRENTEENLQSTALTQEGSVLGTPDYIAPEQARNASYADIRSDLYSLGCTMFYLLTGQPPFPGGALTEKLLRHQLDPAPPVASLRPDAPQFVAAVVARLLAKRPDDRYQTPTALAAALLEGAAQVAECPTALPAEAVSAGDRHAPVAVAVPVSITSGSGRHAPVATPVPDSGDREAPLTALPAPTNPFADMETPVIVKPASRPVLAVAPPRRRYWLLVVAMVVVIVLTASAVVTAKMLFRSTPAPTTPEEKPRPKETPPTTPPDKQPKKLDPVKAADELKKVGARFTPAEHWQTDPKGASVVSAIDLSGCAKLKDDDLALLAAFQHLKSLNLYATLVGKKGLEHLEGARELTTLNLGNNPNITDDALGQLKGLTELQELNLSYTSAVTGSGLAHLAGLKKLTRLQLEFSKVEDAGLAHLTGRTALQLLYLNDCPKLTNAGVAHLKGLSGLTDLSLKNTLVTDLGPVDSAQLARLDLTNVKVGDPNLAKVKNLAKLTELHASGTNLGDKGLAALKNAKKLHTVNLAGAKVGDDGMVVFKTMPELQVLHLTNTNVGDAGLANLAGLAKLHFLDLEHTQVRGPGLTHLKALPELQTLNLSRTQMQGAGLEVLKTAAKLASLSLVGTQINDDGMKNLAELTQLTTLTVANCSTFGDKGAAHLQGMPNLTTLALNGTFISDKAVENFGQLKKLTSLDVRDTKVTPAALAALKKELPNLTTLP
jgi:serine/threonine-protein kinase